jgi:hypothetical protein
MGDGGPVRSDFIADISAATCHLLDDTAATAPQAARD